MADLYTNPLPEAETTAQSFLDTATTNVDTAATEAQSALESTNLFQPTSYSAPTQEELIGDVKEGTSYLTPETKVSEQLTSLIASSSPYMQQAETRAKEAANRMGLLSSSMAIGAAQGEAIRQALPIAQQDAKTASEFQKGQQALESQITATGSEGMISGALKEQGAVLEAQQSKFQKMLDTEMAALSTKLNTEQQAALTGIQESYNWLTGEMMAKLDYDLTQKVAMQEADLNAAQKARDASAQYLQNYQIAVENLLKDPDFTQLPSDVIQQTLNNLLSQTTGAISFSTNSVGVNVQDYVNILEQDLAFTASPSTAV